MYPIISALTVPKHPKSFSKSPYVLPKQHLHSRLLCRLPERHNFEGFTSWKTKHRRWKREKNWYFMVTKILGIIVYIYLTRYMYVYIYCTCMYMYVYVCVYTALFDMFVTYIHIIVYIYIPVIYIYVFFYDIYPRCTMCDIYEMKVSWLSRDFTIYTSKHPQHLQKNQVLGHSHWATRNQQQSAFLAESLHLPTRSFGAQKWLEKIHRKTMGKPKTPLQSRVKLPLSVGYRRATCGTSPTEFRWQSEPAIEKKLC